MNVWVVHAALYKEQSDKYGLYAKLQTGLRCKQLAIQDGPCTVY